MLPTSKYSEYNNELLDPRMKRSIKRFYKSRESGESGEMQKIHNSKIE